MGTTGSFTEFESITWGRADAAGLPDFTSSKVHNVKVSEIYTGLTHVGPDMGSRNFSIIKKPEILILGGGGVSSYDAGEVWHLLDQVYGIPSSLVTL